MMSRKISAYSRCLSAAIASGPLTADCGVVVGDEHPLPAGRRCDDLRLGLQRQPRQHALERGSDVACRAVAKLAVLYLAKISGPLLDRIDLQVEVLALSAEEIASTHAARRRPRSASASTPRAWCSTSAFADRTSNRTPR